MPQPPRFRWRLLVAVPCLLLGGISVLCGMVMSAAMAYGYARFGIIQVNPETPSLNQMAITFENILAAAGPILVGFLLLATAGYAIWQAKATH